MSLWTPYAAEADLPLDLTKTFVKEETRSPVPEVATAPVDYPPYAYHPYPQESYVESIQQPYYVGYPYPPPPVPMYSAPPTTQMSPISGSSTCSGGYETTPAAPAYQHLQPAALSPPVTPDSQQQSSRSSSYTMEADALSDDPDFQAFQRDALRAMAEKNGGTLLGNNPRMRRAVKSTNQDASDDSYRKQRERNNFAAKQSRDRRKLRELQLALKVTYLKNVVANLQARLAVKACVRCQRQCNC